MIIRNRKINISELIIYQDIDMGDYGSQDYVIYPSPYETHDEEAIAMTIDVNPCNDLVEQLEYCCENDAEIQELRSYIEDHIMSLGKASASGMTQN